MHMYVCVCVNLQFAYQFIFKFYFQANSARTEINIIIINIYFPPHPLKKEASEETNPPGVPALFLDRVNRSL